MHYEHTQTSRLYLVLVGTAVAVLALAAAAGGPWLLLTLVAACLVFGAFSFQRLTTRDAGGHLQVEFGPLPLFRRRVEYRGIQSAERVRSDLLDGWGIHWVPGRGWIWNLWGRDCVRIRFQDGGTLRIGTDDPDGLVALLRERAGRGSG